MRFFLVGFFFFAFGCGSSADSINEEWDEFVDSHNSCDSVKECVAVFPGCPLGCATAISKRSEIEGNEKASNLISSYERGGASCAYGCSQTPALICKAGKCGFQK